MKKYLLMLLMAVSIGCGATELKIKIQHRYLNFPVSQSVDRHALNFTVGGKRYCRSVIRLTAGKPDYWVFEDVSAMKGKTLVLSGDFTKEELASICQSDMIVGENEIYKERLRPQYHFTTRRGWINDPNGCIFYKGKYHLFYQHNPYEREWENMHWAHAFSRDLIHWHEMPLALHPDNHGTMFSGTTVIDYNNDAGYNVSKGKPAMIAFYTADTAEKEVQCMAYSRDEGQTWTKYSHNPVVDSHERWKTHDTRDPKVFWYAPGNHWVMVVNERNGNTIYNSTDLKHWEQKSHITGFWECPELFPLAVEDNPAEVHWVMWGASGTYMIGQFDGKEFTPETTKMCNLNGSAYASQTFNNIPREDGRVIKMSWGRVTFGDMPFNGVMLLPQEQILKRTRQGLRLVSRPVKETEQLFSPAMEIDNLAANDVNRLLEMFRDTDVLRMKGVLHLTHATDAGISFRGQRLLTYDLNGNRLQGEFYAPEEPGSMEIAFDLYVDRGVVEGFIDGGIFSYSMPLDGHENKGYEIWGNQVQVRRLEVYRAQSIW